MKKQIIISALILLFMFTATVLVVLYGKGYRFGFGKGGPNLAGTGLLVATSSPDGAQVFVNGHLTTATANTINLAPGTYEVKIVKEGYLPWQKTLVIKNEVVTKADALLFPTAPKLENITNLGAQTPVLDPSRTKIAYTVASQSAVKNGIYILDTTARPILTLQSSSSQIINDTINTFSKAKLQWSPDGSQLLASIPGEVLGTTYLLRTNGFNQSPQDVTETMESVNAAWEKQKIDREKALTDGLRKPLKTIVLSDFRVIDWSADETKILYVASVSAELPIIITPRLIGTDSTAEVRNIQKGTLYVYDIKEDRNYKIIDSLPNSDSLGIYSASPISWFPDSKHLIYNHSKKIDIMEYDAGNQTTIYAGPFVDSYVFPWSDGSRIVILTDLGNPNASPNLYTVDLK
ncbi:MAG: PEGA domain-containing protein [Patescibacteria group bacterium]|nr:PEGA domain-containing protein [Patescibacteria group bacterium]